VAPQVPETSGHAEAHPGTVAGVIGRRSLPPRPGGAGVIGRRSLLSRPSVDAVVVVVLVLVPFFVGGGYVLRVLSLGWLYAILAMGVVVSYGYAGIPNMSQGTLYGVGAYTAANLMMHAGSPFWVAVVGAALVAGLAGGLLGATTLRVGGNYWWLLTIAFTQTMFIVFNSWTPVTGGSNGFVGIPIATLGPFRFADNRSFYYLALALLGLVYFAYRRICVSRAGLAMQAVRADSVGARGLGISPGAMKICAMTLAGLGAGMAGAGIVSITGVINAQTFSLPFSFTTMLLAIVGGIMSLRGAVVAAVTLTYLTTEVAALVDYQLLIYGGAVVLVLMLRLYLARDSTRWPVRMAGSAATRLRLRRGVR